MLLDVSLPGENGELPLNQSAAHIKKQDALYLKCIEVVKEAWYNQDSKSYKFRYCEQLNCALQIILQKLPMTHTVLC